VQQVVFKEQAAVNRLAQLGLTVDDVHAGLKAGQGEARAWSEAAPLVMPGMARWGRTNEIFRIQMSRQGWTYDNPSGLPVTISPNGEFAIVATTGDRQTGSETGEAPTTRYAKGATYHKVVEDNEQLALFVVDAQVGRKLRAATKKAPRATWILLYYVGLDSIAVELSLPASMTRNGYVDRWRERILIPPYLFENVPTSTDQSGDDDGQSFDVAVERR
jgi:hypothetical protein